MKNLNRTHPPQKKILHLKSVFLAIRPKRRIRNISKGVMLGGIKGAEMNAWVVQVVLYKI